MHTLGPIVIVLLVAVIAVTICRHFNTPAMLGYLVVGFIAGPGVLMIIPQTPETEYLGEIGIVFLMFSIGLEFSLPKLRAMKNLVFGLGGGQVALTILIISLTLFFCDQDFLTSFAIAVALAMSSTAIVSRLLSEKVELSQQHGQMVMGILLMQDIAVVPIMILLPALAANSESIWMDLLLALVKMGVVLSLLLTFGQKLIRPWFHVVAKMRSGELFMVNVLLVTLGIAYLTELAGMSLALGAFVAGMLISETEYKFQVEDDIRPFRDILMGFFFITVGMKLELAVLTNSFWLVITLFFLLIFAKTLVVFGLGKRLKYSSKDSLKTAIYLAQGGEFGFVLLALSANTTPRLMNNEIEQAAIAAILLSMLLAPFLIENSERIIKKLIKSSWDFQAVDLQKILVEGMNKIDHVLILGYNKSGQSVARILEEEDVKYFALDLDAERVRDASEAGEPVAFGDAKRKEILIAAGIMRAKAVVITQNDYHETERILASVMALTPTLPIVVRSIDDANITALHTQGADEVVCEVIEGSIALASQTLLNIGIPFNKVIQQMRSIREKQHTLLRGFFKSSDNESIDEEQQDRLFSIILPAGSFAIGLNTEHLPLTNFNVELRSIRRKAGKHPQPLRDFILEADDVLVTLGKPENLARLEAWLLDPNSSHKPTT